MSQIEMQGVEFSYRDQQDKALAGVDLKVEKGEFIAVIGANGSGKSTLAKMMNVLLVPDRGTVTINGLDTADPDNIWLIRQQVGMVFQNPDNQLVATLVEDDVAFGPENLALPTEEIRLRVDQALETVGMDGYQSHPPHKLSGGQKQRVAIAGILAMMPDCIVLDEPTAMLDPMGRKEVLETISRLNREENITVVLITHFMEEAGLADRIAIMQEGRISRTGSPREIFRDTELIAEAGLDVPEVVALANQLRQQGVSLPEVMTADELVNSLC